MSHLPHLLTRKTVVIPVVTLVLALAAFEAYGLYTRSRPVAYGRGGHDFAVAPNPTGLPAPQGSPRPMPSPGTGGATPTPTPAAKALAQATTDPTAPAVVLALHPSESPAVIAVPKVGSYQLAVTGSEQVKFGPVSFCSQTLPSTTHLVVSKAAGESATSYDFDVPYFPNSSGQHDERHIYRYTPNAVYLDYEIATVTCQGIRQSSQTSFSPPQLRAALPLRVGASWHNHGGGSSRTEDSDSKVTRTETVTVAGQHLLTYVIETTTSFTGAESGTRQQTWWYAPTWAMPVKWTEKQSGSRSGASYTGDIAVQVLSRP